MTTTTSRFPYRKLQGYQTWKRAVSIVDEPDPFSAPKFRIARSDKVATAGSCFALHIADSLRSNDFSFYDAEPVPYGLAAADARAKHYGEYSARFGNVYSTVQLEQLFDRAFGTFEPQESPWAYGNGFADPFRPRIEPHGFGSPEALADDRSKHLAAVREMFRSLDVFIFTLGLTESWECRADGAVLPVCPGNDVGTFSSERYRFRNLSAGENIEALKGFLLKLRAVNPRARVLLTVSPVPLAATYEPRHILQATTYSKSVLRVAAEEIRSRYDFVDYVPSYEVITATLSARTYFEGDKRSVSTAGVQRVMDLFFRHFVEIDPDTTETVAPIAQAAVVSEDEKSVRECDEDVLAKQIDNDIARFGF